MNNSLPPADLYQLYMADDEPTAEEHANALAQALTEDKGLATLAGLGGGHTLGSLSQNLFGSYDKGLERVGEAGRTRLMGLIEGAKQRAQTKQHGMDQIDEMRKEFMGNAVVKNTANLGEALQKIRGADTSTGAGQLSLIYGYMRALDPGSSVRESEFENAGKAGGLPSQIQGWFNVLRGGGSLGDPAVKKIREEAERLIQAQVSRYQPIANEYRRLASEKGISPEDVVINQGFDQFAAPPKTAPKPSAPQVFEIDDGNGGTQRFVAGPDGKYRKERK
jgi:hypothetical protein